MNANPVTQAGSARPDRQKSALVLIALKGGEADPEDGHEMEPEYGVAQRVHVQPESACSEGVHEPVLPQTPLA
jgi:hypothetical protein